MVGLHLTKQNQIKLVHGYCQGSDKLELRPREGAKMGSQTVPGPVSSAILLPIF